MKTCKNETQLPKDTRLQIRSGLEAPVRVRDESQVRRGNYANVSDDAPKYHLDRGMARDRRDTNMTFNEYLYDHHERNIFDRDGGLLLAALKKRVR